MGWYDTNKGGGRPSVAGTGGRTYSGGSGSPGVEVYRPTPAAGGQTAENTPDNPDIQPGVIGINPLNPTETIANASESTGNFFEDLKRGLLGTDKPDLNDHRGGLLGDVPVVGEGLRQGLGAIGHVGGQVLSFGADTIGGTLESIPTGGEAVIADQYNALPAEWRKKWEAEHPENTGVFGTGLATNKPHLMSQALREYQSDITREDYKPSFAEGAFTVPATLADSVTNMFDILGVAEQAAQRTAAGIQNIQGLDRLGQAEALASGGSVSTGFLGTGFMAGQRGALETEQLAAAKVKSGEWTREEALDFLVHTGSGWGHDPTQQVFGSIAGDPLNILTAGAGAASKLVATGGAYAARVAKAGAEVERVASELKAAEEALTAARGVRSAPGVAAVKGLGKKAVREAKREVERLNAELTTVKEQAAAFDKYTPKGDPNRFNVLARAAKGSENVANTMKLAGKVYDGMQGTAIGRAAKIARTVIDPLHALDISLPGSTRTVDLMSDVWTKQTVETLGAHHHYALLEELTGLDPSGAVRDQFIKDLGLADANHAREGLADLYRKAQMRAGLGERLATATTADGARFLPSDAAEEALKVTREKDLLKWVREDVVKNVLQLSWDGEQRNLLARQMEATYGIRDAEGWLKYFEKASPEQLSFMKRALYGNANRKLLEGVAASVGHASAASMDLSKLVLLAKGTLTRVGGDSLLSKLKKAKSTAEQVQLIRKWQDKYSALRYVPMDEANLPRSVEQFMNHLEDNLDRLPMQVTKEELGQLHPMLADMPRTLGDSYSLGFRPKDEFLWGLERDNGTGLYRAATQPWVDHVADAGLGYRPGRAMDLNIVGNPIIGKPVKAAAKVLDYMEVGARMMKAQVSGAQIAEVARKRFIMASTRDFAKHGVTEPVAQKWWERITQYTKDHQGYSGPRGTGKGDLYNALKADDLIPQPLLNGAARMNPEDILRIVMEAYDGDMRYIGLTQKLSGRAKRYLFEATGSNFAGQIAEHVWPTLKFRYNPIFQLQEKVEPWVLNAQRGVSFATGTGQLNAADRATESMLRKLTDNSLVRQADLDQAEYAEGILFGQGLHAAANTPGSAMGKVAAAGRSLLEVQGQKRLNMLRTFRKGLGKEVRANWETVRPGTWDDMKTLADVRAGRILDDDEFALQLLSEQSFANDILVNRVGRTADKFSDIRNAWKTGAWHTPHNMGELQPLDLDHVAASLHLVDSKGREIEDLAGLRQAIAAGGRHVEEVSDSLRRLGADPDYIRRVENALNFHWGPFWKIAAERFNLTPEESRALQDMMAGAAELRGMTPVDFMSQVFSPSILDGQEGIVGSLEGPIGMLRKDTRSKLAAPRGGEATRRDLVEQLSRVFSQHLDPSAKKALLMEFRPELRKAVLDGTLQLDLQDLKVMWDDVAESELANRIIGYMDGAPGTYRHDVYVRGERGVKAVSDSADKYMAGRGVTPHTEGRNYHADDAHYEKTAKAYGEMQTVEYEKTGRKPTIKQVRESGTDLKPKPDGVDDRTYKAYQDFVLDTRAQFDHMTAPKSKGGLGLKVIIAKGDPYADSAAMRADVAKGRIRVFAGDSDHPLMTNEQNVMFRAVHDVYGHAAEGFEFGPRGELNAAIKHSQMYSDTGVAAMLTETHGQTAYVNFSDDVIEDTGIPAFEVDPTDPAASYESQFPFQSPDYDPTDPDSLNVFTTTIFGEDWGGNEVLRAVSVDRRIGEGIAMELPFDGPGGQVAILNTAGELQTRFPDFQMHHLDSPVEFHSPMGFSPDAYGEAPTTNGVTWGSDEGEAIVYLSPDQLGDQYDSYHAIANERWEASKARDTFGEVSADGMSVTQVPRLSMPGVPWNFRTGPTHVITHEFGHIVDSKMRPSYLAKGALPEYAAYGDLVDRYRVSDARRWVSEYGMKNDQDMMAELFAATFNPEVDRAALHPELRAYVEELEKTLTDLGAYKPPLGNPLAGKTVREANAAKRGSVYAPQKAGLLPQDILDEFGSMYRGRGRHVESNPDVARAAQMFGKWTDRVVTNGLMKGERAAHGSLLHDIAGIPTREAVPYNQTEAMFQHLATQTMVNRFDDAFRLQYFAQDRSMLERTINHPMFGLYPASYMWGKIGPELIKFMALQPFGVKTGGMARSLLDAQAAIALRREYDPEFDAQIEKLGHSQAMSFAGFMLPSLPWDISASAPNWMKDIAAQGARNEQFAATGKPVEGFNVIKPTVDTVKKLNPLETTLPWAGRALDELNGANSPTEQKAAEKAKGPLKATELDTPLADVMAELREVLSR